MACICQDLSLATYMYDLSTYYSCSKREGRRPVLSFLALFMPLLSLYINNKAGGLIYHRDFAAHAAKLDVNDHLRLASTFNGLALIMKQLAPVRGSSQMCELEADSFVLCSFDTLTGLKFFLTADPDSRHLEAILREVYVLYSDYVLKNPFYESDMPIQCERFDEKVQKLAADYPRR